MLLIIIILSNYEIDFFFSIVNYQSKSAWFFQASTLPIIVRRDLFNSSPRFLWAKEIKIERTDL